MPELPEVETTVRGLQPVLVGRRLASVATLRPDLRRPFPNDLRQRMTGARVIALGRRAKYGLIETDRGDTMIFHLGMSGRWRIDPGEIGRHDHLLIETDGGQRLALNDPRRFGSVDLVRTDEVPAFAPFRLLGPEPLGTTFDAAYLATALAGRAAPIKALLLDQRIVAGLGNIYVCEALNMSGIAPSLPGRAIDIDRLGALVVAVKAVLLSAIAAGGSTLRDYAQPGGELGYFSTQFRVYSRTDAACPCGGTVERRAEGGRSTFWCRSCQH